MNLKNILNGIEGLKDKGELNLEIEGIESNSKNVKKGLQKAVVRAMVISYPAARVCIYLYAYTAAARKARDPPWRSQ